MTNMTREELELENARLRGQVEALEKIVRAERSDRGAYQIDPFVRLPIPRTPGHPYGCLCLECTATLRRPAVLPSHLPSGHGGACACTQCVPPAGVTVCAAPPPWEIVVGGPERPTLVVGGPQRPTGTFGASS